MNNGKQFERLWKLTSMANDLVFTGKREPEELSEALQWFVSARSLAGEVHSKAIAKAAESADVYCFEDDPSQHELIEHLPSQVTDTSKTIRVLSDPDQELASLGGKTATLFDVIHCCLTDVMFDGQPKGLSVATHAVSCGMPCVIVTRSVQADGHHHPQWVRNALRDLAKHPNVAVFETVGATDTKPWHEAFIALMGLQWKFWLAENSPLGSAARRFQKYVPESQ